MMKIFKNSLYHNPMRMASALPTHLWSELRLAIVCLLFVATTADNTVSLPYWALLCA